MFRFSVFAITGLIAVFPVSAKDVYIGENHTEGYIMTESDGYVFMRNAPRTAAKKILKLYDGENVRVLGCQSSVYVRTDGAAKDSSGQGAVGSWCQASAKGKTGWIFSKYIQTN